MNFQLSIWVGKDISKEYYKNLFKLDNQTKVYNASKFIDYFKINKEKDFFDNQNIIILYQKENSTKNMIKEISKFFGNEDLENKIKSALKTKNIENINYFVAIPNFCYSANINSVNNIYFLGNFTYFEDMSYLEKYMS